MTSNAVKNLILLLLAILVIAVLIFNYGTQLVIYISQANKLITNQLANHLHDIKNSTLISSFGIISFSLLYGILHTIGPGHGKIIISLYLISSQAQLKSCISIATIAALVQGISAIVLATIGIVILELTPLKINSGQLLLTKVGFIIITLIGLYWCYSTIKHYLSAKNKCSCSCGHNHLPESHNFTSLKEKIAVIFAIGLRPCSGSLLVLFLSYSLDAYIWGVIATLVIAVGVAISLTALALIISYLKYKGISSSKILIKQQTLSNLLLILKFIFGLLFVLIGINFLLYSAPQEITGGASLFAN